MRKEIQKTAGQPLDMRTFKKHDETIDHEEDRRSRRYHPDRISTVHGTRQKSSPERLRGQYGRERSRSPRRSYQNMDHAVNRLMDRPNRNPDSKNHNQRSYHQPSNPSREDSFSSSPLS